MATAINIRRSSHNVTAKQIDEAVGAGKSGRGGKMRDENGLKKEKATAQGGGRGVGEARVEMVERR